MLQCGGHDEWELEAVAAVAKEEGATLVHTTPPPPLLLHQPSVVLAICLGWIGVLIYASVTTTTTSTTRGSKTTIGTLKLLSLRRSLAELTDQRHRGTPLDVLDIFRFFAIAWIALNHLGSEGRLDVLEMRASGAAFKEAIHSHVLLGPVVGNSALGVEIFLVLSGLLAARSWHRRVELHARDSFVRNAAVFLARRVLRIAPVVWVYVWLASGPLMRIALPKFHSTMVSACTTRQLLSHLTMTNNLQAVPTCLGYLWYLGLDMQLYLVVPLILHFLSSRMWKKTMLWALAAIMGASVALRAVYCRLYGVCNKSDVDIPFIAYPDLINNPRALDQIYAGLWEMYSRPHTKCAPFLLGLLMGHLTIRVPSADALRNYAITHKSCFLLNSFPSISAGVSSRYVFGAGLAVALATVYAILPEYWYPKQGDTLYNIVYTASFRTVFAGATCVMIASFFYSSEKPPRIHPFWSIVAKLTFNVFLLHMPVVYLFNHVAAFQRATSPAELLIALPFALMLSYAASFLFYCCVESPLGRLTFRLCQWARILR